MTVSNEQLGKVIDDYYSSKYPDFILTNRIKTNLIKVMSEGLEDVNDNVSFDQVRPSVEAFLKKDSIVGFIASRQPNLSPVPEDVYNRLIDYMNNFLSNYRVVYVYRKSNHPDDDYLYSVIGYNMVSKDYSCWSSWNMSTDSLNNGHYNLSSLDDAVSILNEQFNDITDEPEKYGMLSNCYSNINSVVHELSQRKQQIEAEQQSAEAQNVIMFNHVKRGR